MKDKIIMCIQCERPFAVTAEEQTRLQERGFDIPRRCPGCRKNKAKKGQSVDNRRKNKMLKKKKDWGRRYGSDDI